MTDTAATPATSTTATETPSTVTTATTIKPGWQTTEFYFALAAKILSGLFAFGLVGDGSTLSRLAGVAGFVLTQMGYTVSRTLIKTAAMYAIVIFAFHSTGCSTPTRQRDLGYTLTGVIAASAALDAYVPAHEMALAKCDPKVILQADCEARVATFQTELAKARKAIKGALDLIGVGYKTNNDPSVATAEAAAAAAYAFLKTLGVSL